MLIAPVGISVIVGGVVVRPEAITSRAMPFESVIQPSNEIPSAGFVSVVYVITLLRQLPPLAGLGPENVSPNKK